MSELTSATSGTWRSAELNLAAYTERIGYHGPLGPTAATLAELHRHHVEAIPFENVDIMAGRLISLDIASLQDKLITRCRGGYCYEHNLLFAAVLERLGYVVTGLSARVTMGSSKPRPPTHMCLRVEADGLAWLVDVGFGGDGILEPIALRSGQRSCQGDGAWEYSLTRRPGGVWALQSLRAPGWLELYTFTIEARQPVDYQVLNWYTSTHPRSPFTQRTIVQKIGASLRRSLVGDSLTISRPGWVADTRTIRRASLPGILAIDFGIELAPYDAEMLCFGSRVASTRL